MDCTVCCSSSDCLKECMFRKYNRSLRKVRLMPRCLCVYNNNKLGCFVNLGVTRCNPVSQNTFAKQRNKVHYGYNRLSLSKFQLSLSQTRGSIILTVFLGVKLDNWTSDNYLLKYGGLDVFVVYFLILMQPGHP